MTSTPFVMARGETRSFTINVVGLDGLPINLTNARIYFTVRDLGDNLVFTKASLHAGGDDTQINIPDQLANSEADKGSCLLNITHDDSDLEPDARWCDCWVVTPSEYIRIADREAFYIEAADTVAFPYAP